MTVREAFAGVRWYLREVSGETAYERYVEHLRREHPDAIVMSRRDFERMRHGRPQRQPAGALLLRAAAAEAHGERDHADCEPGRAAALDSLSAGG